MTYITVDQAQAWCEATRMTLSSVDSELADSMAIQTIARLSQAYETAGWVDESTTPKLVVKIIAMLYVAAEYDRVFSTSDAGSVYAQRLRAMAEQLIVGILAGTTDLVDASETSAATSGPLFYPTDQSTAIAPTREDMSTGPEAFSMGRVF